MLLHFCNLRIITVPKVPFYLNFCNFLTLSQLNGQVKRHWITNSPRPVKLPTKDIVYNQTVLVAGWGSTESTPKSPHDFKLQYTNMTVYDKNSCEVYGYKEKRENFTMHENEFCSFHSEIFNHGTCGVSIYNLSPFIRK